MNQRLFSLLGLCTLVLVLAVVALSRVGAEKVTTSAHEKLFPALAAELTSVDHILLTNAGQVNLEMRRTGETWQLSNRSNYPANAGKIRTLLDSLSRAEKVEAKTSDPTRYRKLGVDEHSDKATLLTLAAGETTLMELIVGQAVQRPNGHFVRVKNDPQTWLIDRELPISKTPSDWLRSELVNLPAVIIKHVERLKLVPVQCIRAPCLPQPGERTFALSKNKVEDLEFSLAPLPPGKEKAAAWLLAGLADGLNGLAATDVEHIDNFDFSKATATLSRFTSFDDQIVMLTHYSKEGKHYLTLHQEAGAAASDELKQTVAAFNARHVGWIYEIASYKGEGFARGLGELVQDAKVH